MGGMVLETNIHRILDAVVSQYWNEVVVYLKFKQARVVFHTAWDESNSCDADKLVHH